jgi:thiol-disulfide isomerase/thioredoxin
MKRTHLIGAAIGFILLMGLTWFIAKTPAPKAGPDTAAFWGATLPDTHGKPQPMAQHRGRVVVVNFWAPWCPPCRAEMPGFIALQEKYAKDGVQFIGIALDAPENVQRFLKTKPTNYPIYLGENGGSQLAAKLGNNASALPYTLVIDRRGEAAGSRVGMFDEASLENMLRPLL